ncbi:MAG: glutathione peroxidase [candidate division Zixibacteria bacterium]|nr:glutathione peroxidase [candidate division Zixibacteria bacterium]
MEKSVHSFTLKTIDGRGKSLGDYAGNILLMVNTASKCGYTPQYAGLETLYEKYRNRGIRILAFPANNFGAQEPGTDEEIQQFCDLNYHVSFDLFSKISVKGEDIHPLYRYLTTEAGFNGAIPWNFAKFLVDGTGRVAARFEPGTGPMSEEITSKIESLLP